MTIRTGSRSPPLRQPRFATVSDPATDHYEAPIKWAFIDWTCLRSPGHTPVGHCGLDCGSEWPERLAGSGWQGRESEGPGMYADGAGLCLRVTKEGTKRWVFRFCSTGGRVGWASVRSRSSASRSPRKGAGCPAAASSEDRSHRRATRRSRAGAAQNGASDDVQAMRPALHRGAPRRLAKRQARNAMGGDLTTYAEPIIGGLPVQAIDQCRSLPPVLYSRSLSE
jgi:hypothetical protein